MSRRPIHNRELYLVAFGEDMTERGTLRADRNWHIFRHTVKGKNIGACDVAKRYAEDGNFYYMVPFRPFIADAIAPQICFWCSQAIGMDERLQEKTLVAYGTDEPNQTP